MEAMRKRVAKSSPDFSVRGISIAFTVDPPSFGGSSFSPPACAFLSFESSATFFGSAVLVDSFKGSCLTSSDFSLCLVWWCGLSLPFLTGASSVSNLAYKLATEIQTRMESLPSFFRALLWCFDLPSSSSFSCSTIATSSNNSLSVLS